MKAVRALSLKEPWASMMLEGKKKIETRVWRTKYRGKIFLCCSKKPQSALSGKAFAIAEIVDCRKMRKEDEKDACCKVYPRAYSWILKNITPLQPFDVQGQLGLFEIEVKHG